MQNILYAQKFTHHALASRFIAMICATGVSVTGCANHGPLINLTNSKANSPSVYAGLLYMQAYGVEACGRRDLGIAIRSILRDATRICPIDAKIRTAQYAFFQQVDVAAPSLIGRSAEPKPPNRVYFGNFTYECRSVIASMQRHVASPGSPPHNLDAMAAAECPAIVHPYDPAQSYGRSVGIK